MTTGVLLPWRQVRWSSSLLVAASASSDDFECPECDEPVAVNEGAPGGRLGLSFSTAKSFGYSISAEEGAAVNVISEFARGVDGETATSMAGELRGYLRAFPRHAVLAARVAGATSHGDDRVRRDFSAAGNVPQFSGFDVGLDAIGLLRGFDSDDLIDRHAAVLNLDYRFPIARPQRGFGTWPFFLRTVHGAAFLDIGHAWDDDFDRAAVRRSLGAELSFDLVLGGAVPLTRGHRRSVAVRSNERPYEAAPSSSASAGPSKRFARMSADAEQVALPARPRRAADNRRRTRSRRPARPHGTHLLPGPQPRHRPPDLGAYARRRLHDFLASPGP